MSDYDKILIENRYLKKVLSFYADCFNYLRINDKLFSEIELDGGYKARNVLLYNNNDVSDINKYIDNELYNYEINKINT